MSRLLRRVLRTWKRSPDVLITGLAGPDKKGGWSLFWLGDGAYPPSIRGATPTGVVEHAAAAVAELYAHYPPLQGAELQLAIYPWGYRDGPMFDIAGQSGAYSAHDIQGSGRSVTGATLEDLIEAVRQMPDAPQDNSMFRWIRLIESLTPMA